MTTANADVLATWRAELADMPFHVVLDFVREQTEAGERAYLPYCPCEFCAHYRAARGLSPGYPPLADDGLPVEVRG